MVLLRPLLSKPALQVKSLKLCRYSWNSDSNSILDGISVVSFCTSSIKRDNGEENRARDLILKTTGEYSGLDNDSDRVSISTHVELLQKYQLQAADKQQLLVIQPFKIRTKQEIDNIGKRNTETMLEETLALVDTLGWTTVASYIVGLKSFDKSAFFGSGNALKFQEKIAASPEISAVFISLYRLSSFQRINLENLFQVPVFDRYNIILQIFQRHAKSKEAKLQVALAEIPYMMQRLYSDWQFEDTIKHSSARQGSDFFERQEKVLKRQAISLKDKLEKVRIQRGIIRRKRKERRTLSVAVVGYTNSGKTSLIKALTNSEKLEPRDQLFATLDVTAHEVILPSNVRALFFDTVGFISDIPTDLIASFRSTLEDAMNADLLIHVRDVSHPDTERQNENVINTLHRLNPTQGLLDNMIVVGNKIDKLPIQRWKAFKHQDFIPISVKKRYGLEVVSQIAEKRLLTLTNKNKMTFRCRTGSMEFDWLKKNTFLTKVVPDSKDLNYSVMYVIASSVELEQFRKTFLTS